MVIPIFVRLLKDRAGAGGHFILVIKNIFVCGKA